MTRRQAASKAELEALAAAVAEALGVGVDALLSSPTELEAVAERRRRALRIGAHIAIERLKAPVASVAEVFGRRTASEMRTAAGALRNDVVMDPTLRALVMRIADTWHAPPARTSSATLLEVAIAAVEHALEAGLAADLRERLMPLLPDADDGDCS